MTNKNGLEKEMAIAAAKPTSGSSLVPNAASK